MDFVIAKYQCYYRSFHKCYDLSGLYSSIYGKYGYCLVSKSQVPFKYQTNWQLCYVILLCSAFISYSFLGSHIFFWVMATDPDYHSFQTDDYQQRISISLI